MKTATKIWIDKNIVGFVVRIINYIVIIIGKLLKIDHSLNKDFRRIAVCKYKGMGSIIQSAPLLKTLKNKFPNSRIIYISSKENFQILRQINDVDEIICINDSSVVSLFKSFIPFIIKLQSLRIDIYIDLEVYSNFSTLVTIFSIATNRMGFYINSMHYRLGNYTHMMYYNTRSPISETYLQFARLLNCDPVNELVNLNSTVTDVNISDSISLNLISEKYLVINPNASDLRLERRWDSNNFAKLIFLINEKYPDFKILLIGSSAEAKYVENIIIRTGLKNNIFSLAGKTDILGLISVIKNAHLFITNDSGPMHIAFSTQTPVIALFGPCSPNQYSHNRNTYVIYENLYCSPCVHEFITPPCKGNNYCMKAITVDFVFNKVSQVIEKLDILENWKDKAILFKVNGFTVGTLNRKNR